MPPDKEISNPPSLNDETNYEEWLKDLEVWKIYTNMAAEKKGPRLYLTLTGKAREIAREVDINEIGSATGLEQIVAKLNEHFQKDKVQRSYLELEKFEKFRRSSGMKMNDYITEFERLNNRIKDHEMTLPDGVVAYKLLHHANLNENEINLIKVTMSQLSYKEVKDKMTKMFSDITNTGTVKAESSIKVEDTFYNTKEYDTYYLNNRRGGRWRGRSSRGEMMRGRSYGRGQFSQRGQEGYNKSNRKLNPLDEYGKVSKCAICESKFHWARDCPDAYENQSKSSTNRPMYVNSTKIVGL